jgi:hypothetical protein
MRGDANGAGDLLAPVEIGEEMLAEALASHLWNSVAGGAGSSGQTVPLWLQNGSSAMRRYLGQSKHNAATASSLSSLRGDASILTNAIASQGTPERQLTFAP